MRVFDVVVIGAGAAGLMCALTAGQRGKSVLVIDRANKVGKKILMSGGGRCNFTNLDVQPSNFISQNPHYCKSALSRYTQWDFISLVSKHGIAYHEREHGQLFCDDSAKQILAMLLQECHEANVQILDNCEVNTVSHTNQFDIDTNDGLITAQSLVIATGALSIPTLGGSGFGYELAKQFGMKVLPLRAGLVPFTFTDNTKELCVRLSGNAIAVTATVGKISFTENMLFTHRGLSGPAILQISNYWQEGEVVEIDLLPGEDMTEILLAAKQEQAKTLLRTVLAKLLPKSLVVELQALWWPQYEDTVLAEIPDKLLTAVAERLNGWDLKPAGTEGYRTAEVTLGGVDTNDLSSKDMQSKTQPDLYFIGEVVDVRGHLGGFNFQWAWASGYAAGMAV
jgi:predicted Rossmann fold flavoprotein